MSTFADKYVELGHCDLVEPEPLNVFFIYRNGRERRSDKPVELVDLYRKKGAFAVVVFEGCSAERAAVRSKRLIRNGLRALRRAAEMRTSVVYVAQVVDRDAFERSVTQMLHAAPSWCPPAGFSQERDIHSM